MKTRQQPDEVIAEVRTIRDTLAAEHDHDVSKLFATLRSAAAAQERPLREEAPKRLSEVDPR